VRLDRRSFLKGTAVGTVSVGGCLQLIGQETASQPQSRNTSGRTATVSQSGTELPDGIPEVPDGFDEVVNVIDAGGDSEGEEPIDDLVADVSDDTLLRFPSGTYRLGQTEVEGLENVGMVAAEDSDPKLVPSEPLEELGRRWIYFSGVSGFLIDGLNVDFREEGYSGRIMITGPGDFAVCNLRVLGRYDPEPMSFRFDVRDEDHNAVINNLTAFGVDRETAKTTGLYVGRHHAGEITFRDCRVEDFPDNGIYASPPGGHGGDFEGEDGTVHVRGGLFRNNNIANIRLGSTGSTVKDATIVVDEKPPKHPNGRNVRGIRLRGKKDQIVENCDIRYSPDAGAGTAAIAVNKDNGRATVRNTRIRMDRDKMPAIAASAPSEAVDENQDDPPGVLFENVRITGRARYGTTVDIVDRDETEFRQCWITQRGESRKGIVFSDSDNCAVRNTTIVVTEDPLTTRSSAVETEDLTTFTPDELAFK